MEHLYIYIYLNEIPRYSRECRSSSRYKETGRTLLFEGDAVESGELRVSDGSDVARVWGRVGSGSGVRKGGLGMGPEVNTSVLLFENESQGLSSLVLGVSAPFFCLLFIYIFVETTFWRIMFPAQKCNPPPTHISFSFSNSKGPILVKYLDSCFWKHQLSIVAN